MRMISLACTCWQSWQASVSALKQFTRLGCLGGNAESSLKMCRIAGMTSLFTGDVGAPCMKRPCSQVSDNIWTTNLFPRSPLIPAAPGTDAVTIWGTFERKRLSPFEGVTTADRKSGPKAAGPNARAAAIRSVVSCVLLPSAPSQSAAASATAAATASAGAGSDDDEDDEDDEPSPAAGDSGGSVCSSPGAVGAACSTSTPASCCPLRFRFRAGEGAPLKPSPSNSMTALSTSSPARSSADSADGPANPMPLS
mmetsp:Transcript_154530/g.495370  ORF Transcript_154530/g.495370 Transcript_154530/m.495370 type:complete len:253 (+) Transcript_154530:699-1457(+)